MSDATITKRMREFLEWAQLAEPFSKWPIEWSVMVRKARDAKLIERKKLSIEKSFVAHQYGLTEAGRSALLP